MKLWNRLFSSKASSVGAMVSSWSLGRPIWQQRDFAKLAKEGYQRNVIVYACVWLAAKAAADVPLAIMRRRGQTDGQTTHAALEALLNRPNPMEDGIAWRQAVFSDFLLGANAYIERIDIGGRPRELYRWRPDRVKVVPGPLGFPEAYEFNVSGNARKIEVDIPAGKVPLLHWRDYNPADDWYGMPALDPAAFAVDSHTGAVAWNKALLDNSAQPSGALVYAPKEGSGKLTDEQWNRLKAELDASFSGSANAGRPLLLDGGLDWKEMGFSPKDMAYVDGKNSAARDIALAIGVPPLMLGIPGDNTYANYAEANKAFYRQLVLPLVWQFCRTLNWWITPAFGQGLSIEPDVDDLPVFADERAALWDRVEKSTILTVNEKREMLGYEKVADGDVILVQSSLVPLESAATVIEGGSEDDPNADPEDGAGDDDTGSVESEDDE
ncbi:MAG: phage portal protein [Phenylobacterium zucineum]|nr:MAG: phage portal protein [Phenylobacterium zucineum]